MGIRVRIPCVVNEREAQAKTVCLLVLTVKKLRCSDLARLHIIEGEQGAEI